MVFTNTDHPMAIAAITNMVGDSEQRTAVEIARGLKTKHEIFNVDG